MLRVFLSHVRDDGVLARQLAEAVKRAGHEPLFAEDTARVGESVLDALERSLSGADAAILCLSRGALAAVWMQTEFQRILARFKGQEQRVLAVRFERVVAPEGLARHLSVDLFLQEGSWDEGAETLVQVIGDLDAKRDRGSWAPRLGNLPPAPGLFVGRGEVLHQLHAALEPHSDGARGRQATLVGEEGMGRSSTALRFAHETSARFPGGIWWCEARGRTADEALARLFPELQRLLPLGTRSLLDSVGAATPTIQVSQTVQRALSSLPLPCMLVIDDAGAEDWTGLLPAGQVSVLMTRPEPEGALGEVIPLGPLSLTESLKLMDALAPIPEDPLEHEARVRVAQELLGGQPLAMSVFAQMQRESATPWSLLEQMLRGHLEEALSAGEAGRVRTALDEALERCTPAMRQFLEATASFEAVIPVPMEWVLAVARGEDEGPGAEQALGAVVITKLLDWDEARDTLSLHPLVRQRIRERMEPAKRERLLRKSMEAMAAWLQRRIFHLRPETLAEAEEHLPHFRQSLQSTEHWPPFEVWLLLALQTASILEARFEFPSAMELLKRALGVSEQLPTPRAQLICLVRLAHVLHQLGRQDAARPYIQRALRLLETVSVHDDFDLVLGMHRLAVLLRDEEPVRARQLAEWALQGAEKLDAPDDVLTGAVLTNLALIRAEAGETAEVLPLVQRALELTRRSAGQDSSFFAERLVEQAQVLVALSDWSGAKASFGQALAIMERLPPGDSPQVAFVLSQLAFVLVRMGEPEAAKLLLERATGILETRFGLDHPEVVVLLHELGQVLVQMKQMPEATRVLSRALEIMKKSRSWDTQLVAATELGLAVASKDTGDDQAARLHFEQALDAGLMFYSPGEGSGHDSLEKALRLARGRQVNPEAYVSALKEALTVAEREGDAPNAARAALLLGAFEGRRGAWETARLQVERGLRLAKQAENPFFVAESHRLLGDASLHGSRYEDARLHYAEAIRRFEELKLIARAARARMLLLVMLLQLGRTEGLEAHASALAAALRVGIFTEPAERAEVEQLLRLTDTARRAGSLDEQGNTE
jgi:tetratricopeptide (TPR) repeat protein